MALKDEKFESFLKRSVDVKICAGIKTYDQTVVLSKTESHAFRFLAVSDEAIYVIDNPPKSILYSIPYSDICSVSQIHDKAKFLQRELQDVALHVLIRHSSKPKFSNSLGSTLSTQSIGTNDVGQKSSFLKSVFSSGSKRSNSTGEGSMKLSPTFKESSLNKNSNNSNNVGSYLGSPPRSGQFEILDQSPVSDTDSCSSISDNHTSPRSALKWTDSELNSDVLEPTVYANKANVKELHAYVLNNNSLVFPMLKAAWRDYLLNSMEARDPPQTNKSVHLSAVNALFGDLKKDIMQCHAQPLASEHIYKYIYELKTAAEQYSIIKKFFWQDGQLLTALAGLFVKCNLPVYDNEHADGLECCILIAETLSLMIKQSEALPNCQHSIQQQSASFYNVLIKALITDNYFLNNGSSELSGLYEEYFTTLVEILYHLVVISEQVVCDYVTLVLQSKTLLYDKVVWSAPLVPHHNFTSQVLFSAISECQNVELFLDLLIRDCVSIWTNDGESRDNESLTSAGVTGSRSSPLTPNGCVRLYRSFILLHRIITKVPLANARSRSKYKEEFKYYIRPDSVTVKVPETYAACAMLRHVIRTVACLILNGIHSPH